MVAPPTAETSINQGFQKKCGKCGECGDLEKSTNALVPPYRNEDQEVCSTLDRPPTTTTTTTFTNKISETLADDGFDDVGDIPPTTTTTTTTTTFTNTEPALSVVPEAEVQNSAIAEPPPSIRPIGLDPKIGDYVTDTAGRSQEITKLASGGWATSEGNHVSRHDYNRENTLLLSRLHQKGAKLRSLH